MKRANSTTRMVVALTVATIVTLSGCFQPMGPANQDDRPEMPGSIMDRTYKHNLRWESDDPTASFIAFRVLVEDKTEWRVQDRIDSYTENVTVWWMYTFLIDSHDGHRVLEGGTGSTNSWPVCSSNEPGPTALWCEPVSIRENLGGAFARTVRPGTYVFFAAMYGGTDSRTLQIEIDSDLPVEILDVQAGRSELLLLDHGNPDVTYHGNLTYADAVLEYHATDPIHGHFRGIRSKFDSFAAVHESGLEFRYERGSWSYDGEWYIDGVPFKTLMFSGPAGNWTFSASGDRSPDGPSSPVLGLLIDPFFVDEEGAMTPQGRKVFA